MATTYKETMEELHRKLHLVKLEIKKARYEKKKAQQRAQYAQESPEAREKRRAARRVYRALVERHSESYKKSRVGYARRNRAKLGERYIKSCNQRSAVEVAPLVRVASIITHRILKGEINVEQANEILERFGSSARIQAPEQSSE